MSVTAPPLDDVRLFERRPGVPILDVHVRSGREIDEQRLRLVCANSNRRAAAGEPGLILIGHTTDDGKETDQPPVVGYAKNYQMGRWDGRPCIMADLYYDRDDLDQAMKYPRRSVEVFYSDSDPSMNYVDAVSLLVRTPERPLGLVTYRGKAQLERYSMTENAPSLGADEIPALQDYMTRNSIKDMGEGIKAFLQAKADGTDKPDPNAFGKADIEEMAKYCRARNINTKGSGMWEAAVQRYKADRNAGTLYRS